MARVKKLESPYRRKRRKVAPVSTETAARAKAVTPLPGKNDPKPLLTPAQLEYRKKLQAAILHVTHLVMEERRQEILSRAKLHLQLTGEIT